MAMLTIRICQHLVALESLFRFCSTFNISSSERILSHIWKSVTLSCVKYNDYDDLDGNGADNGDHDLDGNDYDDYDDYDDIYIMMQCLSVCHEK